MHHAAQTCPETCAPHHAGMLCNIHLCAPRCTVLPCNTCPHAPRHAGMLCSTHLCAPRWTVPPCSTCPHATCHAGMPCNMCLCAPPRHAGTLCNTHLCAPRCTVLPRNTCSCVPRCTDLPCNVNPRAPWHTDLPCNTHPHAPRHADMLCNIHLCAPCCTVLPCNTCPHATCHAGMLCNMRPCAPCSTDLPCSTRLCAPRHAGMLCDTRACVQQAMQASPATCVPACNTHADVPCKTRPRAPRHADVLCNTTWRIHPSFTFLTSSPVRFTSLHITRRFKPKSAPLRNAQVSWKTERGCRSGIRGRGDIRRDAGRRAHPAAAQPPRSLRQLWPAVPAATIALPKSLADLLLCTSQKRWWGGGKKGEDTTQHPSSRKGANEERRKAKEGSEREATGLLPSLGHSRPRSDSLPGFEQFSRNPLVYDGISGAASPAPRSRRFALCPRRLSASGCEKQPAKRNQGAAQAGELRQRAPRAPANARKSSTNNNNNKKKHQKNLKPSASRNPLRPRTLAAPSGALAGQTASETPGPSPSAPARQQRFVAARGAERELGKAPGEREKEDAGRTSRLQTLPAVPARGSPCCRPDQEPLTAGGLRFSAPAKGSRGLGHGPDARSKRCE
ncbi:uncharacterized protein [Struthio camelus]|uniref:uncharacterized protein n=1 Tax=Struthio camelus TaxID=8801 RepID=UPI003604039F